MKILITGVAGFIGFSLADKLLENNKYTIFGIDNLDDYYSVKLKKKRIQILKQKKKFFFFKFDLSSKKISRYLNKQKFDLVFHFAAQAGVRYSLINPQKYIESNIIGFSNLFENLNKSNLRKVIYASSSSVYGDTKHFPTTEKNKLNPKNIYGYSKIINEHAAEYYFRIFKIPFIGLRFFTVYGIWGRPDMFILKVLQSNHKNNIFYLNNHGQHLRDFTSIKDVVKICKKLIFKKFKKNEIYNVCSNKPILVKNVLNKIEQKIGKIKYKNIKKNPADVLNTHGENKKIKKHLNLKKFYDFYEEIDNLINWFEQIKIKNYL